MERRRFHGATITAGLVGAPAALGALLFALSSAAGAPLGFVALGLLSAAGLGLKKSLRPMIRSSLSNKVLPPSSQRLLPEPAVEAGPVDDTSAPQGKRRPRGGLRRKPRPRKVTFKWHN